MSRLDSFIRRMQAQRACIDYVADHLGPLEGPVLELGLGNGRTYDHLRERFPGRAIYVFDRQVAAHPDCIPPDGMLRLGDFRDTLPAFAKEGEAPAAFIHADVGNGNDQQSQQLATLLAPTLLRLLAPGGYLGSDQPVDLPGLVRCEGPSGAFAGRCHLYQRQP